MSETSGEKSFDPTEKRKKDAAEKGDVLRSKELSSAAIILLGCAWLTMAGPWLWTNLAGFAREGFIFDRGEMENFAPTGMMLDGMWIALPVLASIAIPVIAVTVLTQLGIGQGRWVIKNLAFKGSRINPLSGMKRVFSPNGLIEMGKGILKVVLLGGIAFAWSRNWLDTIVGLGRGDIGAQLTAGWQALLSLLFALSGGLILIAMIDVPIQWARRMKRLKMSFQELRDEAKEQDGSPEAKANQRRKQREVAKGAVAPAMREAQFVITNPTHFAVAMLYDPERGPAPIVLAKGRGEKAQAMKELAREFDVPMLEYPLLARSVYYTTRENQSIREELYGAIASVLAFVMSLKRGERMLPPDVHVPAALRFDAEGRPAS